MSTKSAILRKTAKKLGIPVTKFKKSKVGVGDIIGLPVPTQPEKPDLDSYPITELIAWRDTASHDVTAYTEQRDFFALSLRRLDKKRLDKVRWIRRLNTIIARKAFPGRVK